jgi:hypothetical protein
MTTLTYNLTRHQASDKLGISTRTIDRYIKGGKLSYKKIANKILLADQEIHLLADEFSLLHQPETPSEVINEKSVGIPMNKLATQASATDGTQNIKEFVHVLQQKDRTIEEKNQFIFALQHKIGELESKLQQTIALPDYSKEKDTLMHTMQTLELEKQDLIYQVRKEKTRNAIYVGMVLVAVATIMFFALGL